MSRPPRKPWFIVEIKYRAQSGRMKITRSRAFQRREEAFALQKEYLATGYSAEIREATPGGKRLTKRQVIDASVLDLPGLEHPKQDPVARARGGRR